LSEPYKYLFERIGRIPYNEFSEVCTGGMRDMHTTYKEWIKPQWKKAREEWEKKIKNTEHS
jgi:hypothetical protein